MGAVDDTIGGNSFQGSAYIFNRQGGNWVEAQMLTASDGGVRDQFGSSVAISGSTIVVGAVTDTIRGNDSRGSAYIFNLQGGSWVETQKLTVSDGESGDLFGLSVVVGGSTVVVGAIRGTTSIPGSAYVFKP